MISLLAPLLLLVTDPLFVRMEGSWVGEGERVYAVSGRRIRIDAQVTGTVEGDRLVSVNHLQETPGRTYDKTYWLRPSSDGAPGRYELGAGDRVGSYGDLDGTRFTVIQLLGSIRVESVTEFLAGETVYRETVSNGTSPVSEALVRYRRTE